MCEGTSIVQLKLVRETLGFIDIGPGPGTLVNHVIQIPGYISPGFDEFQSSGKSFVNLPPVIKSRKIDGIIFNEHANPLVFNPETICCFMTFKLHKAGDFQQ